MVDSTMVVGPDWLRKQLQKASPDLLREMVTGFIATLMSARRRRTDPGHHRGRRHGDAGRARTGNLLRRARALHAAAPAYGDR